jgi:NADH/NAD ratio-sensing transcriptional regulator Rex
METNDRAELAMRVKALEADVAQLQRREREAQRVAETLIEDMKALRERLDSMPGTWSRG